MCVSDALNRTKFTSVIVVFDGTSKCVVLESEVGGVAVLFLNTFDHNNTAEKNAKKAQFVQNYVAL